MKQIGLQWRNAAAALACVAVTVGGVYAGGGYGIKCGLSVSASAEQIAFGEKVSFSLSGEETIKNATWQITPQKGVSKSSGKGMETGEITFKNPGTYIIRYSAPGHETELLADTLVVSASRMRFDLASVSLSKPVQNNVPVDGTVLSVNVEVASADGKPVIWSPEELRSEGVGTTITGTPQGTEKEWAPGRHTVEYVLAGQTTNENIMLYFKDNYGRIQVFYLPPFQHNPKQTR